MPKQKHATPTSPMPQRGPSSMLNNPMKSNTVSNVKKQETVVAVDEEMPSTSVPAAGSNGDGNETVEVPEEPKQKSRIRQMAAIILHSVEQLSGRIATGFGISPRQMDWYKNCWSQPVADRSHMSFIQPSSEAI